VLWRWRPSRHLGPRRSRHPDPARSGAAADGQTAGLAESWTASPDGTTATGAGWIVPRKYVERVGNEAYRETPVGAEAYKFVSSRSIPAWSCATVLFLHFVDQWDPKSPWIAAVSDVNPGTLSSSTLAEPVITWSLPSPGLLVGAPRRHTHRHLA
jgi:hypothetical protein